jgi:hypothetical protein
MHGKCTLQRQNRPLQAEEAGITLNVTLGRQVFSVVS